jgi:hypothetical protein
LSGMIPRQSCWSMQSGTLFRQCTAVIMVHTSWHNHRTNQMYAYMVQAVSYVQGRSMCDASYFREMSAGATASLAQLK